MENIEIEINKIRPDPNQPRKHFDEEAMESLATSIKNEGVINDIEVDKDFVIITGERRWRGAKIAGLKMVSVKVLDISDDKRLIRQAIENIQQEKMAPLDMATMLDKIRKKILIPVAGIKKGSGGHRHGQLGVTELHKLLGMPVSTVSDYLALLGETGEMKEALKDPNFSRTKVPLIQEAPGKYRRGLRSLVAQQKSIPRETVRQLTKALRRAERYGEDYAASRLLKQNYQGLSPVDALNRINKFIPDEESRVKEPADAVRQLAEALIKAMEVMDRHPLVSLDNLHGPMMVNDLKNFGIFVQNWFKGDTKVLENKLTEDVKLLEK